ncbi:MAG: hypothetical protein HY827_01225 [Actinobacteria bacterium]|nr:hypothetical protein [Actinomycetota bacterium]
MAIRRIAATMAIALLTVATVGCGEQAKKPTPAWLMQIEAAEPVDLDSYPKSDGVKTLDQLRREAQGGAVDDTVFMPAANDFVAGRVNRLPFGIFSLDNTPLWGPTVIYLADRPAGVASGPFPVRAMALDVPKQHRSKTSASDYETIGSGFYRFDVKAKPKARSISLLALTRVDDAVHAALGEIDLAKDDPAPAPGERAPAIKTDTLKSADGDVTKIDTRVPPSDMHDISLDAALKLHKPIVLLFATPSFCKSRVCAPVVDVAGQVMSRTGDDAIFIHQEIYRDNDPNKGFRRPVLRFGITSEPFTFVIGADGRVSDQLQGPFVAEELEAAIKRAAAQRD